MVCTVFTNDQGCKTVLVFTSGYPTEELVWFLLGKKVGACNTTSYKRGQAFMVQQNAAQEIGNT